MTAWPQCAGGSARGTGPSYWCSGMSPLPCLTLPTTILANPSHPILANRNRVSLRQFVLRSHSVITAPHSSYFSYRASFWLPVLSFSVLPNWGLLTLTALSSCSSSGRGTRGRHQIFYLNFFCKEWEHDPHTSRCPSNGKPSLLCLGLLLATSSMNRWIHWSIHHPQAGTRDLQLNISSRVRQGAAHGLVGVRGSQVQCWAICGWNTGQKLDGFARGSCPWRGRLDLRTTSRAAAAGSCRVSPWWVSLLCTKRSILCAAATKQNVEWDGKVARRTHWDWCPQFLSSQGGICTVKSCLSPQKRARIYFCQGLESFEVRRETRSSMFHQCPREIATVTSQKHSNITNQTQMIMNHSLETTNGS